METTSIARFSGGVDTINYVFTSSTNMASIYKKNYSCPPMGTKSIIRVVYQEQDDKLDEATRCKDFFFIVQICHF